MTVACAQRLADDYLTSQGFTLHTHDGYRTAVRGRLVFVIDPACGHLDCPPVVTQDCDPADRELRQQHNPTTRLTTTRQEQT